MKRTVPDMELWHEYSKDIPKRAPRIRRRKAVPDIYPDTLDLHGFTLDEGYKMLKVFMAANFEQGSRLVTIITGRGMQEQSFMHKVPRWLREKVFAPYVASFVNAPPDHGGAGALVVRLKKK